MNIYPKKPTAETLTAAASRSYGRIVNIFRQLRNMGFKSYETLYSSYVTPILNYSSAVCGFGEQSCSQVLVNRIKRFYLGVNGFAPNSGVSIEFDWLDTKYMRWLEMLQFLNRLIQRDDDRWPKIVHKWDTSLRTNGWSDQVSHVLSYLSIDTDCVEGPVVDLDVAGARMLKLNRNHWKLEASNKTKLRTYVDIQDDTNRKALVNANLSRSQRSLASKLKLGILPLQLEVGRWKDVALEDRYCRVCMSEYLEDEYHFVM